MNVNVYVSGNFKKEAKRYLKKFRTLNEELASFQQSLLENPRQGDKIAEGVYKVRLASKSKGKGKSGGFRIINYLVEVEAADDSSVHISVILLSIYDKSEVSTLSDKEISNLIKDYHRQKSNEEDSEDENEGT